MKIYVIYDKREKKFVDNGNGRTSWSKKGSAKSSICARWNGWRLDRQHYLGEDFFEVNELSGDYLADKRYAPTFKQQNRFECREYDLENISEYKVV